MVGASMHNVEMEPVLVGDRVVATGVLREDGSSRRLLMRGEGVYGELFNATDSFAIPVEGMTGARHDGMVTVRGVWTGEAIVDVDVTDGGRGVALFPQITRKSFPDVDGAPTRAEILHTEVQDACDSIRGGALVASLAARSEKGWYLLASAIDVEVVQATLEPLVGTHLHVVPSSWSHAQIWEAEAAASAVTEPFQSGVGWDADGRFRAHMLVHHISPALTAALQPFPAGIMHVEAWLKRPEDNVLTDKGP